jgi:hypothetical protein
MFERGYLEYHAQHYDDASMLLLHGDEVHAVLPAHRSAGEWASHGGLTFGGLVLHPRCGAYSVLQMFDALLPALQARGATRLLYKPVPHIYHRQASEDDLYALFRLGARGVRIDLSTSIDLGARSPLAKGRRHALAKARRAGVVVRECADYAGFWPLLERVLGERHGITPTHSLQEIQLLAQRFEQIRFYGAYAGAGVHAGAGDLLAGSVVYHFDQVLHTQYLAASEQGRACGALDAVIAHLLEYAAPRHRWLNFGASSHDQGRALNTGLLAQKEMFGGRSTILQWLALDLQPTARPDVQQEQEHARTA